MHAASKILLCLAGLTAGGAAVEIYHREDTNSRCLILSSPIPSESNEIDQPQNPSNEICFEGLTEVSEDRVARVTFKEGERIFEVAVRPGQVVRPGDLLFTLKGVHLQQLEQAASQAVIAKRKRLQAATELATEKKRIVAVMRELQQKGNATSDELRRAEFDAAQADRAVEYHQSQFREQELVHASSKSIANEEYVSLPEGFRHATGLVRRVTITPGDMRRGSSFQGVEVVNADQLIVRAVLTASERQKLATAHQDGATLKALVSVDGIERPATVLPFGIDADAATGAVPTVIQIDNKSQPRLPIGVRVSVCITVD